MSSIDRGFWGGTITELERLAGPLQEGPAPVSAFGVLEGTYRGHRMRASWLGRIKSSTAPSGSTLRLGLSLGERPIRTYVWSRKGSSIFGPTATTGDPVFDERYIAAAIPPEVVSAALDAEVRAMIDRRWNGRDTTLDASDGWVSIAAGTNTPGVAGSATPPTPEELSHGGIVRSSRGRGAIGRCLAFLATPVGAGPERHATDDERRSDPLAHDPLARCAHRHTPGRRDGATEPSIHLDIKWP